MATVTRGNPRAVLYTMVRRPATENSRLQNSVSNARSRWADLARAQREALDNVLPRPPYLQIPRPFRTPCFSFFSLRFSLSVLPAFFEATLRGDLSAMSTPFLLDILLLFGGHQEAGCEVSGPDGHPTTAAMQHAENMMCYGDWRPGSTCSLFSSSPTHTVPRTQLEVVRGTARAHQLAGDREVVSLAGGGITMLSGWSGPTRR